MTVGLEQLISQEALARVDHWCSKYPDDQRQSAVMQTLTIVQDELGYLTEDRMDAVAAYLRMPKIAVYEIATFYTMYEHQPVGKYKLEVCHNISCKLCGAHSIIEYLKEALGIDINQTTADGMFTLRTVECLGACVNAPMMQIGNRYYLDLTPSKIDQMLDRLRRGLPAEPQDDA